MKKLALATTILLSAFAVPQASAGYLEGVVFDKHIVFEGGFVHLHEAGNTATTCMHWGYNYRINTNTAGGAEIWKDIKLALLTGVPVTVGYTNSSAPGTDHNSGCSAAAMAVLTFTGQGQ